MAEVKKEAGQFKPTEFILGGKYYTILTVITYPRAVYPGYLAGMTNMPGVRVAIKHKPISFEVLKNMLAKEISDLKVKYQSERDQTTQERIRQEYESLEQFASMITSTQSRIFNFQMHLMITADTQEELDGRKIQVRNYLDGMGMRAIPMMFEQEEALKSMIPIFPAQDIEKRIGMPIPSLTIAGMYPFVFDSVKDPGAGTLLGVDSSGGVVLFNQFLYQIKKENNRNDGNIIIMGTGDSGKSTAAKMLLRTHLRNGLKCVCIDPKGELEEITKIMNGDFIDMGKGGDFGMINPLEIIVDADEDEIAQGLGYTVLTRTLQQLKAFIKYFKPTIEEPVLKLFGDIVQDTYKRFKIDYNTDFTRLTSQDFPTFNDVYATVKGRLLSMTDATQERDAMEKLEIILRPIVNEYKYYFTGHTSLQLYSDFVAFNIRDLMNSDDKIKNALLFNILKYAWGLCLDKNINTVMMIDDSHLLLEDHNELGAEFLAQIQRRSRKYNTGTIIVNNHPSDFAAPNVIMHGKTIFDSTTYCLIMGLKKQVSEELSKLIDLNETEKEGIKYYTQGQALFICGNRRMNIQIICSQEELDSFGSNSIL